jgi:hypothetical protein
MREGIQIQTFDLMPAVASPRFFCVRDIASPSKRVATLNA